MIEQHDSDFSSDSSRSAELFFRIFPIMLLNHASHH
eukprot:SAG11_NODE_16613_length_542_cov_2.591422_1_plen_35_part_01